MDVRDVGVALWRQKLLVGLILVIAGGGAAVGVWLAPKSYTSTATVSAARSSATSSSDGELDDLRATLGQLASSQAVAERVWSRIDGLRSVALLRTEISGHWVRGTILVRIRVHDADPRMAARVANAVATVLEDESITDGELRVDQSDGAQVPSSFSSPDLRLVFALTALGGLALAVAAAIVRDRRTNTVDDAPTVEDAASAPLLARLAPPHDLTTMPTLELGTVRADAFRHLRVAVESAVTADGRSLVVVAGVGTGDVPVWIAANLAIALATGGRRVLLVDGRMGERFGRPVESEPDTPGLYDVLVGSAELGSAMSPGPVDRLSVLPSGTWGDQPVDELLRQRFETVMTAAISELDAVIVLGPPLDASEDARTMAVGAALLLAIVRGEVSVNALRSHADRVRAAGARLLGVVLVDRRRTRVSRAVQVPV